VVYVLKERIKLLGESLQKADVQGQARRRSSHVAYNTEEGEQQPQAQCPKGHAWQLKAQKDNTLEEFVRCTGVSQR